LSSLKEENNRNLQEELKCSKRARHYAKQAELLHKRASDLKFQIYNPANQPTVHTVNLHGQFLMLSNEVEGILLKRILHARKEGVACLRVIVGKGNHSPRGNSKITCRDETQRICKYLGLRHRFDGGNAGAILITLACSAGLRANNDNALMRELQAFQALDLENEALLAWQRSQERDKTAPNTASPNAF
jgi:hypothetical protein